MKYWSYNWSLLYNEFDLVKVYLYDEGGKSYEMFIFNNRSSKGGVNSNIFIFMDIVVLDGI